MRKYTVVLLALSLVACNSVKPRHAAMNSEGTSFITKCAQIEVAVAENSEKLATLKEQKLSSDVEAAIQNYSERLESIENLGKLLNCKFDVTASPKLVEE